MSSILIGYCPIVTIEITQFCNVYTAIEIGYSLEILHNQISNEEIWLCELRFQSPQANQQGLLKPFWFQNKGWQSLGLAILRVLIYWQVQAHVSRMSGNHERWYQD